MDIAVSHQNAGFDALASQTAVTKLYPETSRITPGSESPAVRDFLALHKEYFELTPLEQMLHSDIGRLPVIERRNRIGIITRTDALRILYPFGNHPKEYKRKKD